MTAAQFLANALVLTVALPITAFALAGLVHAVRSLAVPGTWRDLHGSGEIAVWVFFSAVIVGGFGLIGYGLLVA